MSGTNTLIPLAVAVFIGAAGLIIGLNQDDVEGTSPMATAPGIPPGVGPQRPPTTDPSGDTTTETLQTISAQFNQATQQFKGDLTDTRATVDQLKQQLETLSREANTRHEEGLAAQVRQRVQAEVQRALGRSDRFKGTAPEGREMVGVQPTVNYPITDQSLGFAAGTLAPDDLGRRPIPPGYAAHPDSRYVHVVPLYSIPTDTLAVGEPGTAPINSTHPIQSTVLDDGTPTAYPQRHAGLGSFGSPDATPFATVPAGSTLFDATAFTALIGRIPVGGQVVDPMPIKVLIGSDNLAANGHRIHGLRGMVLSGSAIGDATLRCVKANLHAATFVFDDGSIATLDTRQKQGRASNNAFGGADGRQTTDGTTLGWISDEQGNPCIPGALITDAPKRLTALTLAGGLAGAAEAYAEQQITQSVNGGAITRSVTGSNTDFLIGSTASQGLNAALQDLQARFQDRFDAIYVEAGHAIVVHIDQTLPIDHERTNRRLNYPMSTTTVSHELD